MDNVVIDISAWIESFRPGGDVVLGELVKALILKGHVLLPGIIRTEILRGAKNRGGLKGIVNCSDLIAANTPLKVWRE